MTRVLGSGPVSVIGFSAIALVVFSVVPDALAQAPATGLSGVQGGGQGGIFTIPRVDAHVRGIPGVTRPMVMAGPVGGGGFGGGNAGGGGSGMMVNPNWVGAAAMFMPQLLTGNGANAAGAGGAQNPVANRVVPGFGNVTQPAAGAGAGGGALQNMAPEGRRPVPTPAFVVRTAPVVVDPALADERLLAHQRDQAKQGSPSAQLALSRRYATGKGVEASAGLARVWLEAAAENGSEEAQAELKAARAGTK